MKTKDYVAITLAYSFAKSSMDHYISLPDEELDITHWSFRLSNRAYSKLGSYVLNKKVDKSVQSKVKEYIDTIVEPELTKLEQHSPQVLLVLLLDFLINEQDNIQMKMMFNVFNLSMMIDRLYQEDEYKEYIKSHSSLIERILKDG